MSTQCERKIILVGKTGNGKSSLGNVLLGREVFTCADGFAAVTQKCQIGKNENNLSVVDTPGLFDSNVSKSLVKNALEVQQAVKLCPNPHAFLIVLNGNSRFTEEDVMTIDVLRIIFGEQCLKQAVIVFTHIENEMDKKKLTEKIEGCEQLSELIEQCGGRFTRIDNKDPKPEHNEHIISLVDQVSKRGTVCYKNKYIKLHKQELEKSLTCFDGKPVHEQIKLLSERIYNAVEEEKKLQFKIKVLIGGLQVAALFPILKGVVSATTDVPNVCEKAPQALEKSISASTFLTLAPLLIRLILNSRQNDGKL